MKSGTLIQKSAMGFGGGLLRWLVLLCVLLAGSAGVQATNYPFPQNYQYPYGQIYTGTDVQSTIQSLYTTWKSKYYVEGTISSTACARIKFVQASETAGTNTVSEGIAYGMLIMVYMDNTTNSTQDEFDKLWAYYQANLDSYGLMNWKVNAFTGTVASGTGNSYAATDADIDVATALIMADKQWGSTGTGMSNYATAAQTLMTRIWNYEVNTTNSDLKPGDAFNDYANPCYFINNALRLFDATDTYTSSRDWAAIASGNLTLMAKVANSSTGLIPDWCYHDGTLLTSIIDSKFESYFLYDAIRIPWRLAMDYAWYGTAASKTLSDNITTWAKTKSGGDPSTFVDGYFLNGTVFSSSASGFTSLGTSQNPCFSGGLSIGAMTNSANSAFLSKCWSVGSKNDAYGYYYTQSTQLLYMLALTGNMPNFTDMRPKPTAAETNSAGNVIYVDFSKAIATSASSTTASWTVQTYADETDASATTIAVSSVARDASTTTRVAITLAADISEPYIYITYNGTVLCALADSKTVDPFGPMAVTNKITSMAPYPVTRYTNILGTIIYVQWSKEILASSIDMTDFTLYVNGTAITIDSIAVNADDATITNIYIEGGKITSNADVITLSFAGGSITGTTSTNTAKAFTLASVQNMYLSVTCYTLDNYDPVALTYATSGTTVSWSSTATDPSSAQTGNVGKLVVATDETYHNVTATIPTTSVSAFNAALAGGNTILKFRMYVNNLLAADPSVRFRFYQYSSTSPYQWADHMYDAVAVASAGAWADYEIDFTSQYSSSLSYDRLTIEPSADAASSETLYIDDIEMCPPAPTVNFLNGRCTYDGTQLELRFNTAMKIPTSTSEISVEVDDVAVAVTSIETKQGDATFLVLTLATPISDAASTILVSGGGTSSGLKSVDGRLAEAFSEYITNLYGISITTGWRDDFATTTDYVTDNIGVGTSYTAAVESATDPGTYTVTMNGEASWATMDVTTYGTGANDLKQVMDLTDREIVQFKYRVPSNTSTTLYLRVKCKDMSGATSDGMAYLSLPISTSWTTETIDLSSTLFQQYDASGNTLSPAVTIDRTNIYQVMFEFISAEGTSTTSYTPTQFKGKIEFDYLSIGSALLLTVESDTIYEGDPLVATSSADGQIYLVPVGTAPVLTALQDSVFAGVGASADCSADVATSVATTGLGNGCYYAYAYDLTAGAISSKVVIYIVDTISPVITKFDSGSIPQESTTMVAVNEDATVYLVPSGTARDADAIIGAALLSQEVAADVTQAIVLPSTLTLGASYVFYAIDYSNNVSAATSPAMTIADNTAPTISAYTTDTVIKETGTITATLSEAGTIYLVSAANVANISGASSLDTYKTAALAATANTAVTFTASNYAVGSYVLYAVDASGNLAGPTETIVIIAGCVTLNSVTIAPTSIAINDAATATASYTLDPVSAPSTAITSITWSTGTSVPFTIVKNADNSCTVTGSSSASSNTTGNLIVTIVGCSNTVKDTILVTVTPLCPTAISLDATSKSLYVNDTYDFTETLTGTLGSNSVNWSSSDATSVSVDANGTVTANAITTSAVTITASLSCDATVKATALVSVVKTPVTSIALVSGQSDSVVVNSTLNLTATVSPSTATNKAITWTVASGTGSATVASVNDTIVQITGVTVGTVTITGTSADNNAATVTKTIRVVPVHVTSITPSVTSVTLQITNSGTMPTAQVTATIAPTTATDKTVTWSSSATGVATVASGVITAVAEGTAVITITSVQDPSVKATISVTVTKVVPTAISISSTASVIVGSTVDLSSLYTITPTTAYDQTVTWKSLDTTATVSAGVVTGVSVGTARIVVTSNAVSTLSDTCVVTVNPILVTSVTVSPATLALTVGGTSQLSASVLPLTATLKTVTWSSSDDAIATVDADGNVTAVSAGSATITATANDASGKSGSCVVTVSAVLPTSITASDISLLTTETAGKQITYTVLPSDAGDKSVTFAITGTSGIASVSSTGLVTPTSAGSTTITITSVAAPSVSKVITVNVSDDVYDVTGVSLDNTTLDLAPEETASLTATITPANTTVSSTVWSSSDETVATVDQTGVVTAVGTGSATITVTVTSPNATQSATCAVTVANTLVTSITPSTTTLDLYTTSSATQLSATVSPSDATNQNVTWAVTGTTGVVTVTSAGLVTVQGIGTTTLTCTAADGSGVTATVTVTVSYAPATSVTLSSTSDITLEVGETSTLTATVVPTGADQAVTWTSSNTTAVSVENGKITALALGSAVVTCYQTANSTINATVNVTVVETPVTSVTVDQTAVTVNDQGSSVLVTATVLPTNATVKTVTWRSLDETKATVVDGLITGVAEGTTTVQAISDADNSILATVAVTVEHISTVVAVDSVVFSVATLSLEKTGTATITATVYPANATNKTLTWASSDETIATASTTTTSTSPATITVTALSVIGTTNITATSGTITASCAVTVSAISVKTLSFSSTSVSCLSGSTVDLSSYLVINPTNAENAGITWSVSPSTSGTISSTGVFTPSITSGSVVITATSANGKTATITVTVSTTVIAVTGISLDQSTLTFDLTQLSESESQTLVATVTPDDATDKSVIWTSSNSNVTVANGVVTVNGANVTATFTCTITATASNGSKATCAVTVNFRYEVTAVTITQDAVTINSSSSLTITGTVTPLAAGKSIVWSIGSANTSTGASIDASTGVLTAGTEGSIPVIATVTDSDGDIFTDTVIITVSTSVVTLTGITATLNSSTSATMLEGETGTIVVTYTPTNTTQTGVTFESSNTSAVTVDESGNVTAVAEGTATIRVIPTANSALVKTITVTVSKEAITLTALTVAASATSINVGATATITVTYTPTNTTQTDVVYTSSDPSVATVSSTGVITGIKGGTTTITVTSSSNSSISKTITITVIEKVTSIVLAWVSDYTTFYVGKSASFTTSVLTSTATNTTVEYVVGGTTTCASFDEANKKLTGLAEGTITVYAQATDGSGVTSNVLTLTVQNKDVTSVSITGETVSMEVGEELELSASFSPVDATNQDVTWSSSNTSVATVSADGVVTAIAEGSVVITLTSADNSTITDEVTILVLAKSVDLSVLDSMWNVGYDLWYDNRNSTTIDADILSYLAEQLTNAQTYLNSTATDTLTQAEVDEATRLLQEAIDNVNCNCWTDSKVVVSPKASVFPNPAIDVVNVSGVDVKAINVFDMVGRPVASSNTSQVDVSSLANGVYKVVITTGNSIQITTITKLK